MKNFNIGILGCGGIAEVMTRTLNKMDNVCAYAAASRSLEKAKEFTTKFNIEKAYGSYEELVGDENIDLIYIATPHSHHYEHALLCLNNNKHVLCEKAFMVNSKLAKDIFNLAKSKNLFIAEAMWMRYTPLTHKLKSIINDNVIGDVKTIKSELYYPISHVERLYNPNLAGGVLLDLGIYNLAFTKAVTDSKIKTISSCCTKFDTNVDKQLMANITFENGIIANIACGCETNCPQQSIIFGTKGYIKVYDLTNFRKIEVFNSNHHLLDTFFKENQITGFEYQVIECITAINNKQLETKSMTHNDTLDLLDICDTIRFQNNIKYPFE